MSKRDYQKSVEEIRELQEKIKGHQDGTREIDDYVECLKRLQFLRNSVRVLKKRNTNKGIE